MPGAAGVVVGAVGCRPADAVRLAQQGWQVTARDPPAVALDRARSHARRRR